MNELYEWKKEIDFLRKASNFEKVVGGHSGAQAYFFQKDNRDYFIKIGIADTNLNNNLENLFTNAGITHPSIIELNKTKKGLAYIIEEKVKGTTGKDLLTKRHEKYFYEFGFRQGKEFSRLKDVYPDRPATSKEIEKEKSKAKEVVANFLKVDLSLLSDSSKLHITTLLDYIESHYDVLQYALYSFGHTDLKLSNLLIDGDKVISIDFQSIKYKNVARSAYCSLIRRHYEENEKHWAYINGYLDGFFDCNVPEAVYDNLTFYLCVYALKMYTKLVESGKMNYLEEYCKHFSSYFINNEKMDSRNILGRFYAIRKIKELEGYSFSFVPGSYDPGSFVFRCDKKGSISLFLKIKRGNSSLLHKINDIYSVITSYFFPCPTMIASGLLSSDYIYTLNTFMEMTAIKHFVDHNYFEEGQRLGEILASYCLPLKEYHGDKIKSFTIDDFIKQILHQAKIIFDSSDEIAKRYPFTKEETIAYLQKWKTSFLKDQLQLVHQDLKMGNVLYNGKDMCVVDIEGFSLSYQLLNFTYSFYYCLSESDKSKMYAGWVRGYLTKMYGTLPLTLQDQARTLLLFHLIRVVSLIINKESDGSELASCLKYVDKYITKGENIEWLQ